MERKDYKRLQNSSDVATIYGLGQVQPVYGVVQLLNLFEEKTERVRITSKSNSTISDLRAQLQRNVPVITDMIIANRNVIEIVPKGVC